MIQKDNESGRKARILLVALYSDRYPAIGETHGVSVIAGCLENKLGSSLESLDVIDMVALGQKKYKEVLEKIHQSRPNIIGFSVTYGSYDGLVKIFPEVKKIISDFPHMVIFGGPISTYIPEIILTNVHKQGLVVIGEGDETIVAVVQRWLRNKPFDNIPNLCFFDNDTIKYTNRSLVDISKVPPPYRKHIRPIATGGAQIYLESSRGCSWAACTFCLRGLTDVKGTRKEYRKFTVERLVADFQNLFMNDIQTVTFADEDFFGGSMQQCEKLVSDLEQMAPHGKAKMIFDVSMTINSVYSTEWSNSEYSKRKALLKRLRALGLRKVFLGIESGSPNQLKRYAKGHTPYECSMAAKTLRDLGIRVEIGFIMFDPLCSLDEIEDNIKFLQQNNLVGGVSSLANELRLQIDSDYLHLLKKAERVFKRQIFDRDLDYNTLSYSYNYVNSDVLSVVETVRNWYSQIRFLHYPLKNLSRYGQGGILGHLTSPVRQLLNEIRETFAMRCLHAVKSAQLNGSVTDDVRREFSKDILTFSSQSLSIFKKASQSVIDHPIVSGLLESAEAKLS